MSVGRLLVVGFVLIGTVLLWTKYGRAQESQDRQVRESQDRLVRPRVSLSYIEDKARDARNGNPKAVREFTDELFIRSPLGSVAPSIKDRVFRNELAFREGRQPSVLERDLVRSLNDHLKPLEHQVANGDAVMRTTPGQVRLFREFAKFYIPHLSHIRQDQPVSGRIEPEMSPSEAVFVAMHLVSQKLTNPEYQVAPEAWEADVAKRRLNRSREIEGQSATTKKPMAPYMVARVLQGAAAEAKTAVVISPEISSESSTLVQAAHAFLDQVGFQR